MVVTVGLLDQMAGRIGLGGRQRFAALGVERLGVDDDTAFDRVPYGLFGWVEMSA